ncbi:mitochondrial fission regulator 2 [Mixophyes fleayi]|uniref:mitochondrial fission regulator 2 n=1 Tax=Mixophyes fleayi TaxID=3061075 RepID=UPI003F4DCC41
MSLLLELIRQLLEYLNIPTDRLLPIWENYTHRRSFLRALGNRLPAVLFQGIDIQLLQVYERKDYGWSRSVVRIIGTLLPLEPCHRLHVQRVLGPGVLEPTGYGAVCRPEIPSLADAPCLLDDDDAMSFTRFRHALPSNNPTGEHRLAEHSENNPGWIPISSSSISENSRIDPSEHAIQKIAALEDELMQLRAQIAAIVAIQESKNIQTCNETINSFDSPNSVLSSPSLASTPLSVQFLQTVTPAPPPPPPPPPLPPPKVNAAKSAIDLIKERKASHKHSPKEKEVAEEGNVNKLPSMLDVLKGMNSIRLRAVERSPGGTPLTSKYKKRCSLNDPAAIIAHALKQKFAHRQNDDLFDKENRSHEESPFSSPETPMFGRHLLKPAGKRMQKDMSKRQVFVKSGPHV